MEFPQWLVGFPIAEPPARGPHLAREQAGCFTKKLPCARFRETSGRVRGIPTDVNSAFLFLFRDHLVTKIQTARFLICLVASAAMAGGFAAAKNGAWQIYSEQANGDVYFYDTSRLQSTSDVHRVWMRIRYKRNVMAAASYQSLLEVDCSERTERTLQRTFFSDRGWEQPAMKPDVKPKKKRSIRKNSANERLAAILCAP